MRGVFQRDTNGRTRAAAAALTLGATLAGALPSDTAGAAAIAELTVSSKIDKVVLYSRRARVSRVANVTLRTSAARVTLADLPRSVPADSVRVSSKSARIVHVEVARARGQLPRQQRAEQLLARADKLADELRAVADELGVLAAERRFVRALEIEPPSGAAAGRRAAPAALHVDAWSRILRWSETRERAIAARLAKLREQRHTLRQKRHELRVEARGLGLARIDEPVQRVIATLRGRGRHRVFVSYEVLHARWKPSYDLRYDHRRRRVEAIYYAEVRQKSGEDWSGARLRFSTARPARVLRVPRLMTWTLGRARDFTPRPRPHRERSSRRWTPAPLPRQTADVKATVQQLRRALGLGGAEDDERVKAEANAPTGARGAVGGKADFKDVPLRDRDGAPPQKQKAAAPPAEPKPSDEAGERLASSAAPARVLRDRVRAVSAGSTSGGLRRSTPRQTVPFGNQRGYRRQRLDPDEPAAAAKGYRYTLYARGRHDIRSGGKAHRVPVLRTTLAVRTIHRVLPGKSEHVYLLGELQNRTGRPILRGHANLFSDGMFTGRSFLRTALPGRELRVPLGVDDSVKVARNLKQRTVTEGLVFKDDATRYTVTIEIANRRRYPIKAEVIDQVPLELGSKVEIKDVRFAVGKRSVAGKQPKRHRRWGWTKPDGDGRVRWFGKVGANEVEKISFSFTIVRPKDWRLRQVGG